MSETLTHYLNVALTSLPPAALCVAFSGGPDSTALLHALAQLPSARARGLRALHVDHRMHASSGVWATHCLDVCESLGVPCEVLPVEVDTRSGLGMEASARNARYAALATGLRAGEYLLLAHHRDDQAETVLLKLLRGAGPEGLGGMRPLRPFAEGQLWRPLLELPRRQLSEHVTAHNLDCIHDPSNGDTRLARNHLRHQVLPELMRHWPQAVDSIVHSAKLSRQAADALQTSWLIVMDALHDPATGSLDAAGWLATDNALREPLLDHWLHAQGLSAPTTAQRLQIEHQCGARAGQQPCIRWRGTELHIWRGRLWATATAPEIDFEWQQQWHGEPLLLPDGSMLSLNPSTVRLAEPLRVRLRRGGERIKPAGDRHTRELRDLFQHAGMPPWQRLAVPLIDAGNELVAVADRWISDRGVGIFEQAGAQPRWQSPHRTGHLGGTFAPYSD